MDLIIRKKGNLIEFRKEWFQMRKHGKPQNVTTSHVIIGVNSEIISPMRDGNHYVFAGVLIMRHTGLR